LRRGRLVMWSPVPGYHAILRTKFHLSHLSSFPEPLLGSLWRNGGNMANDILAQALALFQQGFDTVNSIQGLVIALIAAFMMRRFGQLIAWAITATVAHEVVTGVRRYLAGDASILPNLTDLDGDLKLIGIRFLGYLIAIAILYIIRRMLMNR